MRRLSLLTGPVLMALLLVCHFKWWSPMLLAHGSSSAFDLAIVGWILLPAFFLISAFNARAYWKETK